MDKTGSDEDVELLDLGDVELRNLGNVSDETRQTAPGSAYPDSLYFFGIRPGFG